MNLQLLVILLSVLPTLAVIRSDYGGGGRRSGHYSGGGGGGHHHHGSSSSSDSDSWEHGGHRPPHRPPPNRPPPATPRWVCETGYTLYMRTDYAWCIKVISSAVLSIPLYAEASANCVAMGAALTGYENDEERMGSANQALEMMISLGQAVGGLWIGASLNAGCMNPSCGPYNTYSWTDGFTTGTGGFHWGVGEPDNINWGTGCIQQFIVSPAYNTSAGAYLPWVSSFLNGDLDKYTCTNGWPFQRFYACGKKGTLVN